jgi:aminomethyltransferase
VIGYDAVRETVGFVSDMDRYVLDVRGDRAERVLGGLLTQSTAGVAAGAGRYSFFLDPKGRVVADARLLPHPARLAATGGPEPEEEWDGSETGGPEKAAADAETPDFRLDIPSAARASIDAHLARYVPPIFAEIAPAGVRVMSLLGPAAPTAWARAAAALGTAVPAGEMSGDASAAAAGGAAGDVAAGGPRSAASPRPLTAQTWTPSAGRSELVVIREPIEVPGVDVYVPESDVERVADALEAAARALGGGPADLDAWNTARIETGLPVFGTELGPDRLAQEAGQDARAIAFDKGCYTGQEVVARIHYRGHVNRHLRGIRFEGPVEHGRPDAGAELFHEGRSVGLVTSRTESPALGPIALAYVRREIEPGTRLRTEEDGPADALVCELPFTLK